MKIRTLTEWKTCAGKKRVIRLYKAWRNLCGRVQGHNVDGAGNASWVGVKNEFNSWQHFREWSLANGYSQRTNSCDRENSCLAYSPGNCRWISVGDNIRNAHITVALNKAIQLFQSSAPTQTELDEQIEFERLCLGIY
jgi:hypothetical protein